MRMLRRIIIRLVSPDWLRALRLLLIARKSQRLDRREIEQRLDQYVAYKERGR